MCTLAKYFPPVRWNAMQAKNSLIGSRSPGPVLSQEGAPPGGSMAEYLASFSDNWAEPKPFNKYG